MLFAIRALQPLVLFVVNMFCCCNCDDSDACGCCSTLSKHSLLLTVLSCISFKALVVGVLYYCFELILRHLRIRPDIMFYNSSLTSFVFVLMLRVVIPSR